MFITIFPKAHIAYAFQTPGFPYYIHHRSLEVSFTCFVHVCPNQMKGLWYQYFAGESSRICKKKRLVQAFSEVSASGLSTSASTHLALVFVCHQWLGVLEFTNATELQVSKQKQPLHPVFPPMSRGMATAKKEIQTVST